MSISGKIQETIEDILAERDARDLDPNSPAPVSEAVENGSRKAIFGGRESPAWKAYMGLFADSTAELDRLVPPASAPDPNPDREKARAYLVCNGMCGMNTGENLGDNVDKTLDL